MFELLFIYYTLAFDLESVSLTFYCAFYCVTTSRLTSILRAILPYNKVRVGKYNNMMDV